MSPAIKACAFCREPSSALCTKCLRPLCKVHTERTEGGPNRCPDCGGGGGSFLRQLLPQQPSARPARRRPRRPPIPEEGQ